MTDLGELLDDVLVNWTDMQGHLPRLVELAEQSERIIELGTRGGISTVGFLYGLEGHGHLWSVDIDAAPPMSWPHWTFVQGDDCSQRVLDELPYDVDVVLIDTSHAYAHTLRELELYLPRVKSGGRILLHDTEVEYPDGIGPSMPFPVRRAVETFCADRGLEWTNTEYSFGMAEVIVP